MRVLMVYNEPVLPPAHPEAESEREILVAVESIAGHLGRGGITLDRLGVGPDLDAVRNSLRDSRPDVVFNLFEGLGDDPHSECRFARILEEEEVAFTGCSSQTLWRAGRKDIAKELFRQACLPTADYFVVNELPLAAFSIKWPAFVKPAFRDASIGIDQQSVVTNRLHLEQRIARVADEHGFPVLVELYVDGREISVAAIQGPELLVLPPVETLFVGTHGDRPIVTYDGKWRLESRDYQATPLSCPADLTSSVAECLADVSRRAFRALECRDFVTMDFRVSADGTPYLLEVNPNPSLKPTQCLTDLMNMAGISYSDFLSNMVHSAIERGESKECGVRSGR